jgi:hypothetical protein
MFINLKVNNNKFKNLKNLIALIKLISNRNTNNNKKLINIKNKSKNF